MARRRADMPNAGPGVDPHAGPRPDSRPDPRTGPNVEARHEAARRQAMVDLMRAGRGGGLLSLPGQLNEADRRDILENGERAAAWRKLYGAQGPHGAGGGAVGSGLGRLAFVLGAIAGLAAIVALLLAL